VVVAAAEHLANEAGILVTLGECFCLGVAQRVLLAHERGVHPLSSRHSRSVPNAGIQQPTQCFQDLDG
jgi:hypothetical protein